MRSRVFRLTLHACSGHQVGAGPIGKARAGGALAAKPSILSVMLEGVAACERIADTGSRSCVTGVKLCLWLRFL